MLAMFAKITFLTTTPLTASRLGGAKFATTRNTLNLKCKKAQAPRDKGDLLEFNVFE